MILMEYRYSLMWTIIVVLIFLCVANPYLPLAIILFTHLFLWTMLCGGVNAMLEIVEAKTQPELPIQAPHPVRRPSLVVIGSALGLGHQVVDLAKRKRYSVQEGDVMYNANDNRHIDLTSITSIKEFCARCPFTAIDVLVCVAGVCDASGVPVQNSLHPRMLWVNFLGHVCVVEELKKLGVEVKKIVVVSSGSCK
jgi:hypothetical protein